MARHQKALTKKELASLKERLELEKAKFIYKNVYLSDEFNLSDEERADEVDQASVAQQNAQRLRFRNREAFYERKIEEALRRLNNGQYGACEECDSPIGYKRLFARPTADLCIMCKEDSERSEYSTLVGRQSKSLGRSMEQVTG